VPIVCCTSDKLPPTSRPFAVPGTTARDSSRPMRDVGHATVSAVMSDEIVDRWTVKASEVRASHQPEMERGDVRVSDERFGIVLEDCRVEMWKEPHRAVAAGARDHGLHLRVEPHPHQIFGAALVFGAREARQMVDLRIEQHGESGALERPDATLEPA